MAYNFTVQLLSDRGHKIEIDPEQLFGCWEYKDGSEGGGLWFTTSADGSLELIDYDGVFALSTAIVSKLREAGFGLDETFD